MPKTKTQELKVPDGDFWIFDNQRAVIYHYKNTKAYTADTYDETDDISELIELKSKLLKIAQPV